MTSSMKWGPDLHEISSAGGFWRKNTVKVLELKTFQFRNTKQKHNPDFFLFFVCLKRLYKRLIFQSSVAL